MKKVRFLALILLVLALFLSLSVGSFAKTPAPLLVDEADLLTASQEEALREKLLALSEELDFYFLIMTVSDIYGTDIEDYADNYQGGYGFANAAILVVDMSNREWCVATYGDGNEYISTEATYDYLEERFVSDLSAGNYARAFDNYLSGAEKLVREGQKGNPYEEWIVIPWSRNLLVALVVGAIVAVIVAFSLKSQLKSVSLKQNAAGYVRQGSFKLTRDRDIFLYRTHTRVYSPQQKSSGGVRGGGGSRGGGRGKF